MTYLSSFKKVIAKSADGTEIYADAVGDPLNPVIIFIHGFSLSAIVFDEIFNDAKWSKNFYLIRYDTRGHGRSGKPTDEASWDSKRLSEDFDAVVQAFSVHKPFVAAWSLGATNVADILSFHPPGYLSGVINIIGVPYTSAMPIVALPEALTVLPPLTQSSDVDSFQQNALAFVTGVSKSIPYALQQAYLGNVMTQPREARIRLLTRTQDEAGFLKAGKEGALKLLLLYGTEDRLISGKEVHKVLEGWKGIEVVVFEGVDHLVWLAEPEQFREKVLGWVNRVLNNPK